MVFNVSVLSVQFFVRYVFSRIGIATTIMTLLPLNINVSQLRTQIKPFENHSNIVPRDQGEITAAFIVPRGRRGRGLNQTPLSRDASASHGSIYSSSGSCCLIPSYPFLFSSFSSYQPMGSTQKTAFLCHLQIMWKSDHIDDFSFCS